MTSISKFKAVWIQSKIFFIESEEESAYCPKCGSELTYFARILRGLKDKTGKKDKYSIRILKCNNDACPTKYHREIPDRIIPFKRYDANSIEEALDNTNSEVTVAADESTIYRWRKWFESNAVNIMMALLSVVAMIKDDAESTSLKIQKPDVYNPREKIRRIVGRRFLWLNETVRILVNSSKWLFNRSAFLSG